MENTKFVQDYDKQQKLASAIDIALGYCEENIPKTSGWIKTQLEVHYEDLKDLKSEIGNSFIVGHWE